MMDGGEQWMEEDTRWRRTVDGGGHKMEENSGWRRTHKTLNVFKPGMSFVIAILS
jgi:hypothetical protein